jgi:hypothetical protein
MPTRTVLKMGSQITPEVVVLKPMVWLQMDFLCGYLSKCVNCDRDANFKGMVLKIRLAAYFPRLRPKPRLHEPLIAKNPDSWCNPRKQQ